MLSQRVDGVWQQVLARDSAGPFTFTAKLLGPTSFRLAAGALTGPTLKLPVAPRVRVSREPAALAGTVVPPAPGAAVDVQRLEGESWTVGGASPRRRHRRLPRGARACRQAPTGRGSPLPAATRPV